MVEPPPKLLELVSATSFLLFESSRTTDHLYLSASIKFLDRRIIFIFSHNRSTIYDTE